MKEIIIGLYEIKELDKDIQEKVIEDHIRMFDYLGERCKNRDEVIKNIETSKSLFFKNGKLVPTTYTEKHGSRERLAFIEDEEYLIY